jgi:hypothetical protein
VSVCVLIYVYIYIYKERERGREREQAFEEYIYIYQVLDVYVLMCVYIYIYIYIYIKCLRYIYVPDVSVLKEIGFEEGRGSNCLGIESNGRGGGLRNKIMNLLVLQNQEIS